MLQSNSVSPFSGSPPPMRGKVCSSNDDVQASRITPAYAGKRSCGILSTPSIRDHPRLCGEKFTAQNRSPDMTGSPPPMRGKVSIIQLPFRLCGITPAYAGKSRQCCQCKCGNWDHPRLCGEKQVPTMGSICKAGSPPPMRGKDHDVSFFQKRPRITPAYAGKRR